MSNKMRKYFDCALSASFSLVTHKGDGMFKQMGKRGIFLLGLAGAMSLANAVSINDTPVGWASTGNGTTGGSGGTVVVVTTFADLTKYAMTTGKYIIYVSGVMGTDVTGTHTASDVTTVKVGSDKTIFGLPGSKLIGGFIINKQSNVIIRNMTIQGPGAYDVNGVDGLTVQASENIWVDHCDFYDGMDGNLDVVDSASLVTISWTKFHYTSNSVAKSATGHHRFSNLLGNSDTKYGDSTRIKVTMQYDWWADGVDERMPRVRFGQVHVVNNLYTTTEADQAVRAGYKANLLVEGNAFIGTNMPVDLYNNDFTAVTVRKNLFSGTTGADTTGSGTAFTPPYTNVVVIPAANVQAAVQGTLGTGATLCDVRVSNCLTGTSSSVVSSSSVASSSSVVVSSSSVSSSSKASSSSVASSSSAASSSSVASSSSLAIPVFTKHGTGASSQTVTQDSSIVGFYFSWTNATTVTVQGVPTGVLTAIDPTALTITFSGTVTADPGAYTYVITTVGGDTNVTKSGVITVVAAASSSSSTAASSSSVVTAVRTAHSLALQSGSLQHQYDLLGRFIRTIITP